MKWFKPTEQQRPTAGWEPGFLKLKLAPLRIRGWAALMIGGKPHGPRQFVRIRFEWKVENRRASFDGHIDRNLQFPITRTAKKGGTILIYDRPKGGRVIFSSDVAHWMVKGDTVILAGRGEIVGAGRGPKEIVA